MADDFCLPLDRMLWFRAAERGPAAIYRDLYLIKMKMYSIIKKDRANIGNYYLSLVLSILTNKET